MKTKGKMTPFNPDKDDLDVLIDEVIEECISLRRWALDNPNKLKWSQLF